jgi:hypothetical protein
MGHTDLASTMRYLRPARGEKAQKMDKKIFEDCEGAVEEANLYNERPYGKQSLDRELLPSGELHHMATMIEMQNLLKRLS